MLSQSRGEQDTMIILAQSMEEDPETLVMTGSSGLEDAVVELGQSTEEEEEVDEIEDKVVGEDVVAHSSSMEEVLEEHGHCAVGPAEGKLDDDDKVSHYTREEVVVATQDAETVVGDCAGLNKDINTLARLRICVDQDIERVRQYHLFDKVLPSSLGGIANQMWAVCAMLTNINGSLS
ncbi:uncharacterized protein WCC33_018241 [Rhinophrynus dorsalis]